MRASSTAKPRREFSKSKATTCLLKKTSPSTQRSSDCSRRPRRAWSLRFLQCPGLGSHIGPQA